MTEDNKPKQILDLEPVVPEKHFVKWMQMQFSISRLKILCDLTKESFPYLTVILLFILTAIIYPPALIVVIPSLITFLIKMSKKN
jgi:hypothetical protein